MPEYPDIALYRERIEERLLGQPLLGVRIASPFVLRTYAPTLAECAGKRIKHMGTLGKRLVFGLEDELFLVVHLMIAGRFRFSEKPGEKIPGKVGLLAMDTPRGTLLLTEASPKKRASLHVLRGEASVRAMDPGGIDVLSATATEFGTRLQSENRTLKRALTDPRLLSGIGNAYSDEILFAAGLSPVARTQSLSESEVAKLHRATQDMLLGWAKKLKDETPGFPEKVTAFRPDFAMHGKFGKPCPRCGGAVQRIRYASNESNYCPHCQTGGKLLADRSLSRLLRGDWPKSLEELEERKQTGAAPAKKSLPKKSLPKRT